MSMSWQEVPASMKRQTLILCVYRMMMETIRPRLSVFTISPEK
uniref:Alternative protein ZFYVE9 n=1 Tax=Homo sapiens TaxID=9606 RepID=L8ECB6_HUMAN|nr:alternative protein ZFYVE9 [Homo sapiens]